MRAKEYAQGYRERIAAKTDPLEAAGWLAVSFVSELIALAEARNCQTDDAYLAIWDELQQKWLRLAQMLPEAHLRGDGLDVFLKQFNYDLWLALDGARRNHGRKK